ncbi:hypothetical protein [Marinoscillum furvescens]|uniref:Uncharacterized protein n=1 Tax=Marinoscillum furvescens DSM 4134 TaxID=1122208 RepID=A0A3D9L2H6_MARFU|nr:hypothetical protein [Marinoscillum furvescens]RED95624.1 hypothetical protein C7460_11774 [Marinoscillum furvescens DSM 4134]
MKLKNLDQAFIEIAEKKSELAQLEMQDPKHAALQREIEKLESEFQYAYGSYIEEALFNVHDEYCPDNEVLRPVSYLATSYRKTRDNELEFDVDPQEGIPVDADDFPGIKARLVLVPGPTRLILQGQQEPFRETVWVAS